MDHACWDGPVEATLVWAVRGGFPMGPCHVQVVFALNQSEQMRVSLGMSLDKPFERVK